MSHAGFEEKARKKREAMVNCSIAMLETIRSYGFAATLDFVVRISNYDPIVSELLRKFYRVLPENRKPILRVFWKRCKDGKRVKSYLN